MFNENTVKILKCSFCGEHGLSCNLQASFLSYADPNMFVLDNVDKIVDGVIGEYLEYKCSNCGATEKYTIKDIEKAVRKELTARVIYAAARAELTNSGALVPREIILIYCGKCNGFDGKGSCLYKTYKMCKVKRFPNGL